jgi:hypothetical protein
MLRPPIRKPRSPAIPLSGKDYDKNAQDQIFNALRIYFTQLDRAVGQLADAKDYFNGYLSDTSTYANVGTVAAVTVGTSYVPLVSVKLAADSLTSTVVPWVCTLVTADSSTFQVALIKNATLTGAAYDTSTLTHVDFDITASALADGTVITSKIIKGVTTVNLLGNVDRTLQLVDTDVYTLAAKVLDGGTGDISGSIEIIDYV